MEDWSKVSVTFPLVHETLMKMWVRIWKEEGWSVPDTLRVDEALFPIGTLILFAQRGQVGAEVRIGPPDKDRWLNLAKIKSGIYAVEDALNSRKGESPSFEYRRDS